MSCSFPSVFLIVQLSYRHKRNTNKGLTTPSPLLQFKTKSKPDLIEEVSQDTFSFEYKGSEAEALSPIAQAQSRTNLICTV